MDEDTRHLVELIRHATTVVTSATASLPDELRALKAVRDALDVALRDRLAELDGTRTHDAQNHRPPHNPWQQTLAPTTG